MQDYGFCFLQPERRDALPVRRTAQPYGFRQGSSKMWSLPGAPSSPFFIMLHCSCFHLKELFFIVVVHIFSFRFIRVRVLSFMCDVFGG